MVVHIFYYGFNVFKLYLFYLWIHVSHVSYVLNCLFFFTFIMYLECHCFMYVGVNTSTLKYQDSSCRNGSVYTKESIFKDVDGTNIVM